MSCLNDSNSRNKLLIHVMQVHMISYFTIHCKNAMWLNQHDTTIVVFLETNILAHVECDMIYAGPVS